MKQKYMSESEAVQRSGKSRAWHQRKRWDGSGPEFVKLDHSIMYDIDRYDAWFEAKTHKSTSEYPTQTPVNRQSEAS